MGAIRAKRDQESQETLREIMEANGEIKRNKDSNERLREQRETKRGQEKTGSKKREIEAERKR